MYSKHTKPTCDILVNISVRPIVILRSYRTVESLNTALRFLYLTYEYEEAFATSILFQSKGRKKENKQKEY